MLETLSKLRGRLIHTVEVIIGKVKNPNLRGEARVLRYPGIACATANSTTARKSSREHAPCRI